jgi:hypothetical protein
MTKCCRLAHRFQQSTSASFSAVTIDWLLGFASRAASGGPARDSTRNVDDLVKALGTDTSMSKSEMGRICTDLDEK